MALDGPAGRSLINSEGSLRCLGGVARYFRGAIHVTTVFTGTPVIGNAGHGCGRWPAASSDCPSGKSQGCGPVPGASSLIGSGLCVLQMKRRCRPPRTGLSRRRLLCCTERAFATVASPRVTPIAAWASCCAPFPQSDALLREPRAYAKRAPRPPSTCQLAPVTNDASVERRNATQLAISIGLAIRPIG